MPSRARTALGPYYAGVHPLVVWDVRRRCWIDLRPIARLRLERGERLVLVPPKEASHRAETSYRTITALSYGIALMSLVVLSLALAAAL